jgi:dienelactone hydrolase
MILSDKLNNNDDARIIVRLSLLRVLVISILTSTVVLIEAYSLHRGNVITGRGGRDQTLGETKDTAMLLSSSFDPSSSNSILTENWTQLIPSCFPTHTVDGRQFAKDDSYLQAIQNVWRVKDGDIPVEMTPFVYLDPSDTPLYGHLVRRRRRRANPSTSPSTTKLPGILLFHTAAGPQDIFLFYKAYELVQEFDSYVLICDILSDETGWAWSLDRTRYNEIYHSLLENHWTLLGSRSLAAVKALLCAAVPHKEVDPNRIAAIGWCLGGKPILDLGLSESTTVDDDDDDAYTIVAMSTFHGVFARDDQAWKAVVTTSDEDNKKGQAEIFAFNGIDDPFISQVDLDRAKERLEANGHKFELFQMEGAKHGFSNPAQAWNDSPAFDYNESAAKKSWEQTIALLHRRLGL